MDPNGSNKPVGRELVALNSDKPEFALFAL